jgi:uncharacterized protein (TIGR02231 family)
MQFTGENWPDVALTLSTASPQLGSAVPTLSSWKIGIPPLWRTGRRQQSARAPQAPQLMQLHSLALEAEEEQADEVPMKRGAPMPSMPVRQAYVAQSGVLNATFGIPGRSNIPSDEGEHKVVIAVLDLQADLAWICVPREKESVFLTVTLYSLWVPIF